LKQGYLGNELENMLLSSSMLIESDYLWRFGYERTGDALGLTIGLWVLSKQAGLALGRVVGVVTPTDLYKLERLSLMWLQTRLISILLLLTLL